MNRSLLWALRPLRPIGVPKSNGLRVPSRNLSAASVSLARTVPPHLSPNPKVPLRSLRRNHSVSETSEAESESSTNEVPTEGASETTEPKQVEREVILPVAAIKGRSASFGKIWLRDNCQCSKCVHPDTRQRIVDTFSLPEDLTVLDTKVRKGKVQVKCIVQWACS
ncbi:uncharacterized protein BJX67DRAFT_354799 [Aspergillus lucknowensis]|uniref:Gamma-butyrobetaine hydroxylase-like N-terminal domain-containing protein n=1 Tax=Aspergillus lucknowensis TaxID=176173 RepID=A0ABR4LQC7_9EURO